MALKYPTEELIIEYNALAVTIFDVKKADRVEVLNRKRISNAIKRCKNK